MAENNSTQYVRAEQYFNEQQYTKAFPLIEKEAKKGSKPSMYRLGYMYQNGLGVKQDNKMAAFWFQQSASRYEYTLTMESKAELDKKTFKERLSDQIDPNTNKEGAEYALLKMDSSTNETKNMMASLVDGDFFGLLPYNENVILPVSYSSNKYPRISAALGQLPIDYQENTEVEFQLSLKKPLTFNLFGWHEYITFAYTQKVWWQLYSDSAPFRETNYLPELFMSVPSSQDIDDKYGLKAMKYGFLHESNGQEGYRSRSWNRIYATGQFQYENIFIAARAWYRIPEDKKSSDFYNGTNPNADGDDNPNIYKYLGYGDVKVNYLFGKSELGSTFRYNFGAGGKQRGSINAHWSYPFFNSENTFWYIKFFNGYGESLIDYDRSVTKTAFGFSFSRGLF
jgi:phospholipase A1